MGVKGLNHDNHARKFKNSVVHCFVHTKKKSNQLSFYGGNNIKCNRIHTKFFVISIYFIQIFLLG